jgi:hypothetical protein
VRDACRDPDPHPAIVFARFQQEHAVTPRSGEAIGQHATGGAGADDDVVELRFGHASALLLLTMV